MFLVFACRAPERGEPGPRDWPGWFGLHGAFLTDEEARRFAAELNAKNGYRSIQICEVPSQETRP